MTHHTTDVSVVEDPAKGFGERVRGVDDPRDMLHDDVATLLPTLDGEHLDVNMPTAFGGDAVIDHVDSGHIVFVDDGGVSLGDVEFM